MHGVSVTGNIIVDQIADALNFHTGVTDSVVSGNFGIAIYGGTDNTTVRAGTYELNWNIGLGAIWLYALDRSIDADIQLVGTVGREAL